MAKSLLPFRLDIPLALSEHSLHYLETRAEQYAAGLLSDDRSARPRAQRGTAVIPIQGVMLYFDSWIGTNMTRVGRAIDMAVAAKEVDSIILDIDSPGGTVMGTPELWDKVFGATARKPVIAAVNPMAASAAYYVASAASEVHVTKSGEVGSIGVWASHVDQSGMMERIGVDVTLISAGKYKVEGNPYEPLPDDTRAEMQRVVNDSYREFLAAVGRGRGISPTKVKADFGQGRMIEANRAQRLGMVDGVATFDQVIEKQAKRGNTVRQANADDDTTKLLAAAWNGTIPVTPFKANYQQIDSIAQVRECQAEQRAIQPMLDKMEAERANDEYQLELAREEGAI